jgi:LysM repeat protein
MFKVVLWMCCVCLANLSLAFSAEELTRREYIETWKEEAIYQMALHKIPASITLAQGILESRDGNSRLAKEANNHFGIKCHSDWEGRKIYEDDDRLGECFRHYPNARESFEDHSVFLKKNRYASLFELDLNDYKGWAHGLKQCGYATNPDYAKLLIRIIEENNLVEYDKQGIMYAERGELPAHAKPSNRPRLNAAEGSRHGKREQNRKSDERSEITVSNGHEVLLSDNDIKYVLARAGDTPESIAREIDLNVLFIRRFNDFNAETVLAPGDKVYLQPKRLHASKDQHEVVKGDTWISISQQYGIKLKQLYKLNKAEPGSAVQPGQKVLLRKG